MHDHTAARPPVLVADIGGTNLRLALARGGRLDRASIRRTACADWADPVAAMAAHVRGRGPVGGVCVAVAGPVTDGVARMSNRAWRVDAREIAERFDGVPVRVMNDLEAQGHALDHLPPDSRVPVIVPPAGQRRAGPRLVIGVGTGFNAAVVHDTPAGRLVTASEAGHATLPALDPQIAALAAHIAASGLRPGIEEALSGRGLRRIAAFLGAGADAGGPVDTAQGGPAVALFVRLLGAVAGDLALVHLPWGGVHLVGGMAQAVAHRLEADGFAAAFCAKGLLAAEVARIPVWLGTDDYAALAGCAACMDAGG